MTFPFWLSVIIVILVIVFVYREAIKSMKRYDRLAALERKELIAKETLRKRIHEIEEKYNKKLEELLKDVPKADIKRVKKYYKIT